MSSGRCEKNGCTRIGELVREFRSLLCNMHEVAAWRLPAIIHIGEQQFIHSSRREAHIRAGDAVNAHQQAVYVNDYSRKLLDTVAAWLLILDSPPMSVLVPALPATPDPVGPDDNGGAISMYGCPPPGPDFT